MTILAAIFAGGAARRFGGDKAAADLGGEAMLDRIARQLRAQADALVVVGRDWPGLKRIEDFPEPGIGPLGALAGALLHACESGHALVLTSGCDLPDLPGDLANRLAPAPAVLAGQPLVGMWPSALFPRLRDYLSSSDDRAMRGWIAAAAARRIEPDRPLPNINTRAELAAYLGSAADRP